MTLYRRIRKSLRFVGVATVLVLGIGLAVYGHTMITTTNTLKDISGIVITKSNAPVLTGRLLALKNRPTVKLLENSGLLDFVAVDTLSCGIYLQQGDYENAGISCISAASTSFNKRGDVSKELYVLMGDVFVNWSGKVPGAFGKAESAYKKGRGAVGDTHSRSALEILSLLRAALDGAEETKRDGDAEPSREIPEWENQDSSGDVQLF